MTVELSNLVQAAERRGELRLGYEPGDRMVRVFILGVHIADVPVQKLGPYDALNLDLDNGYSIRVYSPPEKPPLLERMGLR